MYVPSVRSGCVPSIASRIQAFLAAAGAIACTGAAGAVMVRWECNLVIPPNADGLYINVETQVVGTSGSAVPGWDINPYGTTALSFFGAYSGGTYVRNAASGGPTPLAVGACVSATSTYSTGGTASFASGSQSSWALNSVNYFGFRFVNQAGETRYGFGAMQVGSTPAQRTLLSIAFESSGGATCYTGYPPESLCAADLTRDWTVDGADLGMLLAAWGACGPPNGCPADLNDDGQVDGQDLGLLLARWGPCSK